MNTITGENQTGQELAVATHQGGEVQRVERERKPMRMGSAGIDLQTFVDLWNFANVIANSGMAPKGIQSREAITVAIQMGLEVGLPPMTALQNIAVINGRPSIWGDAQLGIVRASGQLERYEEAETNNASDLIFRELCLTDDPTEKKKLRLQLAKAQAAHNKNAEDFGVTVFVQRRGFEGVFGRFTVADAKQANLYNKDGPWKQYPARMLKFRARSFALRDQFGDALKGLLSAEEAQDLPPKVETAMPNLGSIPEVKPQPMLSAPPVQPVDLAVPAKEPAAKVEEKPAEPKTRRPAPTKREEAMKWVLDHKAKWSDVCRLMVDEQVEGVDLDTSADGFCNSMTDAAAAWVVSQRINLEAMLQAGGAK